MPNSPTEQPRGRYLEGVHVPLQVTVKACGSCGAAIWWGKTRAGKPNPFDMRLGKPTTITHFSTCPNAREHSKR